MRGSAAVADINVTPLIDVMLVLLIIFMVVTPIATRGLDAALPEPAKGVGETRPDTPMVLSLLESGMSLNRTPVATLDDLAARLRDILETRTNRTLFVSASGRLAYGRVVEAMDVARGAGVERIGIVTADPSAAPAASAPRTPPPPSGPRP